MRTVGNHFIAGFPFRWEKFVKGERNFFEQVAGAVVAGGGALFLRYTEIVCGDQELNTPLDFHTGEQADGNEHPFPLARQNQTVIEHTANTFGNGGEVDIVAGAADPIV